MSSFINQNLCNTKWKQMIYYNILEQYGVLPIDLVVEMLPLAKEEPYRKKDIQRTYEDIENLTKHKALTMNGNVVGIASQHKELHASKGKVDALWTMMNYFNAKGIEKEKIYETPKVVFPSYKRPLHLQFTNPVTNDIVNIAVFKTEDEITSKAQILKEYMEQEILLRETVIENSQKYEHIYGKMTLPKSILMILTYDEHTAELIPEYDMVNTYIWLIKSNHSVTETEPELILLKSNVGEDS